MLRTAKAKWAMGVSAGLWLLVLALFLSLVGRSGGNENFLITFAPLALLGSFIGFLVTALLLWTVLYVGNALGRAMAGKPR